MEGFAVDLKTFLSLAIPNQYSLEVHSKIKLGFGVVFWGKKSLIFTIPMYCTTVLYGDP